ncbi:BcpO-related WXXGXW repeat protein [Pseudomonas sp. Fl5BN2]|uniref:YXWGXW repeat-containing protein n=1 Tax=unclassified Pseudomonas TaxID=196821 RepID=UPI0013788EB9|nr:MULTISPECIES: YXWGXW repeat-containing protein [unclassified Pseudomonas]NBF04455.1 BcpO-related WXXGXW repeat protein [Pseudomonas sp. Fl5BN2]NBF10715.1 BcpO-related WXXGXW repeat protein [Pseudomonas sp. Fl4BN1]
MLLRYTALLAVVVVASGCVEERVVHERRVVERSAPVEYVEVVAPQPPPERVIEVEPEPRPGYLWARGYWHWNGQHYVAVRGHWEPQRPGYRYVHPYWERHGDGWHWHAGAWAN